MGKYFAVIRELIFTELRQEELEGRREASDHGQGRRSRSEEGMFKAECKGAQFSLRRSSCWRQEKRLNRKGPGGKKEYCGPDHPAHSQGRALLARIPMPSPLCFSLLFLHLCAGHRYT